jgi:galactose mutarotase-like enzyme
MGANGMNRAPSLKRLQSAFPQIEAAALIKVRKVIQRGAGLARIDVLLQNHGVEYIHDTNSAIVAMYSNSGDCYAPTILYRYPGKHGNGTYQLTTVGDFVETYERNHRALA